MRNRSSVATSSCAKRTTDGIYATSGDFDHIKLTDGLSCLNHHVNIPTRGVNTLAQVDRTTHPAHTSVPQITHLSSVFRYPVAHIGKAGQSSGPSLCYPVNPHAAEVLYMHIVTDAATRQDDELKTITACFDMNNTSYSARITAPPVEMPPRITSGEWQGGP